MQRLSLLVRPMTIDDYDAVRAVWIASEGVFLADADTRESLGRYLIRNPRTSFVALVDDVIVGAILCGHDGRRASMHHLAVASEHRGQGIGRALVENCLSSLAREEINCSYIFVLDDNESVISFWEHLGWDSQARFTAFKRRNALSHSGESPP